MIWTLAKKELRGYFNSAVAVIFLTTFLSVTLYTFFWQEKFFARGLADVRPLFEWLPKLLIILVAALSMRLWAEERRAGTLEVLLTLPIPRWKLVAGKFVAGMLLIAIGLVLTFGLPITISSMGNLDMGPVLGGYLAALLLSAAYLSIGMCVSALTDNQIVAFVGTAAACGLAYALGGEGDTWFGQTFGTGERFESVARGVLDLRDLAYYASIVAIGVAVNVLLLGRLTWSRGPAARDRRVGTMIAVGLVVANAIVLNLWLSQVHRARIDLTEDGTYSLSPATEKILAGLDEPLLIRGYFSAKSHPKLAPLVPQIRDLLDEYRVAGGDKVRVEWVDPTTDDAAKREAKERFDLDPTPIEFATASEESVVNAYYAIAIEYGDQHALLSINDLIQVRAHDVGKIDVSLSNLEYKLTKAIKKTVSGFSSIPALFASTQGPIKLTAYITPETLPENWKDGGAKLQKAVDKLQKDSGGKLTFTTVTPKTEAEYQKLFEEHGLRPFQDLFTGKVVYFHLVLQVGDRAPEQLRVPDELSEAGLETLITDGLKRAAPGFTRVVGLWVPPEGAPMDLGGGRPQRMPPAQSFENLEKQLQETYEVRRVDLGSRIPEEIEVLLLAGPANLDAKAAEQVDQFVMRGGSLVVLAGKYRLRPARGIEIEKVTTGLETLFAKWGITMTDQLVMDEKALTIPVPRLRDLGNGTQVEEVAQMPYPFFIKLTGNQLAAHPITSGLPGTLVHFAAPLKVEEKVGNDTRKVVPLLRSSQESWLTTSTVTEPPSDAGFEIPKEKTPDQVLGVAITGGFASGTAKPDKPPQSEPGKPATPAPMLLEHSPPNTRIVVLSSSELVSDTMLNISRRLRSDIALTNLQLVHNAIDWTLLDEDLLEIRAAGTEARALTIDEKDWSKWRTINFVIAFGALAAVVGLAFLRRRAVRPVVGKEAA